MHLADLQSYLEADRSWWPYIANSNDWARKAILNIASSGKFSSDRTIAQYAKEIWEAKPCQYRRPASAMKTKNATNSPDSTNFNSKKSVESVAFLLFPEFELKQEVLNGATEERNDFTAGGQAGSKRDTGGHRAARARVLCLQARCRGSQSTGPIRHQRAPGLLLTRLVHRSPHPIITQAICDYRRSLGSCGPIYMGKDTHALSGPAQRTALEVLAGNGIETMIQRDDGFTRPRPSPCHPRLQPRPPQRIGRWYCHFTIPQSS